METGATSELSALKTKLRATWIAGDFGQIAKYYATQAEDFINRLDLEPGMKVLDVACGTGNLAIPAARTGATVTGVDIAPNLVEQARENAKAAGLNAKFDEGDAEALPYDDASFDAVVTMFGAMFAPRPELVAAELKRVCRPGGFIAMANWTPGGFIGQDVQDNVVARSATAGHAVSGALGRGRNRSRAFRRGHLEAGHKASKDNLGVSVLARGGCRALPSVLRSDTEGVWRCSMKTSRLRCGKTWNNFGPLTIKRLTARPDVDAEYLEVIARRA